MNSTIDMVKRVSFELEKAYRGKILNVGGAVISTAYVLSKIEKNPDISTDSLEAFTSTADISSNVSEVLNRNLNGLWDTVISFAGQFNENVLEDVILYDDSFFEMNTPASFDMSTPVSLVNLANSILEINEQDNILDICSGGGTFPVCALRDKKINKYTGIEINFNLNDVAVLRGSFLGDNYSFVLGNALNYHYPANYDKIFSNYPFILKGKDLDEIRYKLQNYFGFDNACISRCSSDWLFNATIIHYLKKTGKAVAIMTNGAAYNRPDMLMRQYFAENGYIESVINLPSALFSRTSIPTTMVVFSHNNKSIRLVNAENIFSKKDRRYNTLSDENIQTILDCIKNGGENTIDVSLEEMCEHDYNLMASHYLDKPVVENGVPFGDLIKKITRGSQIKPELLESYKSNKPTNYRFVSLANVVNGLVDIEEGQQYITEIPKSLERFVISDNSIILTKIATPTFRSAVVNSDDDNFIIATGNLYIIEIDESKADPYYIQAFFDSEAGEEALKYASGGSVLKTISVEAVRNILIPILPLDEQKKIAQKYKTALEEYTVLKHKTKEVLERKRTLLDGKTQE